MRSVWVLLLVLLLACRQEPGKVEPDTLVLELGGDQPLLAETLDQVRPPKLRPESRPESRTQPVAPTPEPRVPAVRTVKLAKGQTLYALCKQHLGSGERWREVSKLNGWTEAQANHLREGVEVRLPAR